ncbi:MAG: SPFH domain-containing protein [Myxococcota bacterium]|nr:SPFH domain-containing protein [Myxococcota bacterium]
MAQLRRILTWRHLRAEPTMYVMHYRGARLVREGRGLAFWFVSPSTSVVEIPLDHRELTFHFSGRSNDYQEVSVQGVITYRVSEPKVVASRVDFSLELKQGRYTKQPLESIALVLTQLGQQFATQYVAGRGLEQVLSEGYDALRERMMAGFHESHEVLEMGLEVVSVRVSAIKPTAELERALQMPTMEQMQQRADEATFQRRALAVEKERAIQENELATKIELARRNATLIAQQGDNEKRKAQDVVEATKIRVMGDAEHTGIQAEAEAARIVAVEGASVDAERLRMEIYQNLPPHVVLGLAARELASNLTHIDHLNLSPDAFGPLLQHLMSAGTKRLEE